MLKTLVFRYCTPYLFAVPLQSNLKFNCEDRLHLDDINEDDKTDTRIEAWLAAITPNL